MVAGDVVAARLVRLACARHLRDLEDGKARGLAFDPGLAQAALDFFPTLLRLHEGAHAGQPFVLEPWQQFVVGSLFGWVGADGYRRFRTAYVEIGKGNGKTPLAAGIGLYGLMADDEPGAEVYAAAVTADQAGILFKDADHMVTASPALRGRIQQLTTGLYFPDGGSVFRAISSERRSLDGKRVHMALVDEIHEHPTDTVVNKLRAGTKGRRQALIVEITNSGYDRQSVCYQHHEYSEKVLEGVLVDDSWFAFVCGLDPCAACLAAGQRMPSLDCAACDAWTDERTWPKANPNLDVSVTAKYLREQVREALGMPAKQNIVQRLNFCRWTESVERWLPADAWAACAGPAPITPETLRGRRCWLGLDLSSTRDLTAGVLVDPDAPEGHVDVAAQFWLPEAGLPARVERDRVPYDVWARDGHLALTSGAVVDYDAVVAWVAALGETHRIELVEVCTDPWNATDVKRRLMDLGLVVVDVRQGFQSLTAPSKALERLVAERALRHGGHPVLAWNAANVVVEIDPAGNLKPSKKKSTERIDGIAALVTALARAIVRESGTDYYETHDVRIA